ncbi:sigma 54-interacting transcriptional regulator [Pendulispora rubella]|uniref:Sigma 54-interacting transcriptional regulator n=1 Tax=Pendulispora rubella TaxID=2741070 RepID=A0ABZ2KRZ5_9BACT
MPSMLPPSRDDVGKTQTAVSLADETRTLLTGGRVALVVHYARGTEIARLVPDVPLVLGRAPAEGLRIDDPTLSREHARFMLSNGRIHAEDLGSKNGTRCFGRRVERADLELGDEVVLGNVRVAVQALGIDGESLGIDGEHPFRQRLDQELTRARQFRRPCALLLVRIVASDSDAGTRGAGHTWLEALRGRIRPVDRVAVYGADAAHVLLPESGVDDATRIARAIAASPVNDAARFVIGVSVYPDAGTTAEALIEHARDAARRAAQDRDVVISPGTTRFLETGGTISSDLVAGREMRAVLETVARVASSRLPVVLHGETGTGKEVLARLIHEQGPRRDRRMVRVNCGAIPKDLVESMLFGHERGAFTGAVQQQKGVFEEANGGTVFLDEIGELPLGAQAVLLRVLETGSFARVGSNREMAVDVRIVAATHRDLEAMAESGAFRPDLYYRLGGVVIEIPPLRGRDEEIEPLVLRFLRGANTANGRNVEGVDPDAMQLLRTYPWPGNVRELRNAIERAVVVAAGALIGPEDLPERVRAPRAERNSMPTQHSSAPPITPPPVSDADPIRGKVQDYEARILRDALEASGWNRAAAALCLAMPVRTLSYRMKVLGIKKPTS